MAHIFVSYIEFVVDKSNKMTTIWFLVNFLGELGFSITKYLLKVNYIITLVLVFPFRGIYIHAYPPNRN